MQVNIDEVNATRRKLAVEVPVEEVAAEFDRAFGRVQKQAKLKGFRPGRAPRSVVEKLFGDQVRADVLSHLIEHSYADAVKHGRLSDAPTVQAVLLVAAKGYAGRRSAGE